MTGLVNILHHNYYSINITTNLQKVNDEKHVASLIEETDMN